ncbi:MAG: hypothetical protein IJ299_01055 [Oscillospiraceae bacterium]|nr:hypothetical protein [Oscillospiraceae bacterium]
MKEAKNPIKVNFEKKKIVVSRPFAIRAASPNSKEYRQLTDVQMAYPEYQISVRTIQQPQHDRHKGLTYSYMEYYISTHDNSSKRMAEYNEIRLRAECHSMKYANIRKWFLSAYPQIDDFTPEQYLEQIKENTIKTDSDSLVKPAA